jgi:HIP---CoA ligase
VVDGPARPGAVSWDDFLARGLAGHGTQLPAVGPGDLADIIFTSGTTGAPKGAMLDHGPSVRTYEAWCDAVGLVRGDRYLCVYPFFHTAGLKSAVLACVLRGATILPHAVFDAGVVMQRVADEHITVLPGPPTVFQSMLEHPERERFDLSTLRLSVTGAASVPVEVVRRMRDDLHIASVVTGYGLTETTGTVSMCHHDDPPEVVATTVGRPLPGVSVRVADDEGAMVPPGETGEILVKGFNVMRGYFDDPEATAGAFDDAGYLRTGDIGFVADDGNLRITDRKKDMFIVGGFNAFPAEIEGIMLTHAGVAQVAVVGVPDDRMGEVARAYVVRRNGHGVDQGALIAWCRDHMANYKVPKEVHFVDELPLTASGKVQRFRLRQPGT